MRLRAALLAAALLTASCSRQPAPAGKRALFILPFENLSGDPKLDWLSPALQLALVAAMEESPALAPYRAASRAEAASLPGASPLLCRYDGSAVRVSVDCWLEASGVYRSVQPAAQTVEAAVKGIGTWLNAPLTPARPVPETAWVAFAAGRYEDALAAAPDAGALAVEAINRVSAAGDRDRARKLLDTALARSHSPRIQARLRLIDAGLRGDRNAELDALLRLNEISPPDKVLLEATHGLLLQAKRYADAAAIQKRTVDMDPTSPDEWNQLGYARSWAGDAPGAVAALEQYARLLPKEANPLDSLGEVNYYAGRMAEAERYFLECNRRFPDFQGGHALYKAALARLWMKDEATAAAHWEKFLSRRDDKDYLRAQWLFLTGRRADAEKALRALADQAPGDLSVKSRSQAAFWTILRGDRTAAQPQADRAMKEAAAPNVKLDAVTVRFLAQPPVSAAQWEQRYQSQVSAEARQILRFAPLAFALILEANWKDAATVLERALAASTAADDYAVRILLAKSYRELGRAEDARKLLAVQPIPREPGFSPFDTWLLTLERDLRR